MSAHPNSLANLKPIPAGQTRNPGGKPVGARNKLQGRFLNALADDFEEHGKSAIIKVREEDPSTYIRVCASLMPKEVEVSRPLDDFTDDELRAAVATLRAIGVAQGAGAGTEDAGVVQQTQGVSPVRETA